MKRYLAAGAVLAPATLTVIGCWPVDLTGDCSAAVTCGAGTTGPVTPPECVPGQAEGGIDGSCGVFVASAGGDDGGEGSKERPFASLAKAIERAGEGSKRVYVCTGTFTESIRLAGDVEIFGGLDCEKGWVPAEEAAAKTVWTAASDEVPLRVGEKVRARLVDIHLIAVGATEPGGSSIGVIAENGAALGMVRCSVSAGDGANGAAGKAWIGIGQSGKPGADGEAGCVPAMGVVGGLGGDATCAGVDVAGGAGGSGLPATKGGDGSNGSPESAGKGKGGKGQPAASTCDAFGAGHEGAAGTNGAAGNGATDKMLGRLSPNGFAGASGDNGESGQPGQGGGGGGGAGKCVMGVDVYPGPSGGGGGSGGCGGAGGRAGKGGGASLGIVSLGASLSLSEVKISTGKGGAGGAGSAGRPGDAGGAGGATAADNNDACPGGPGGTGGQGGRGGGGRGGHSIGIAYLGTAPDVKGVDIKTGEPGAGGDGDDPNGKGAGGEAANLLRFN